jgi:hypothetical protein
MHPRFPYRPFISKIADPQLNRKQKSFSSTKDIRIYPPLKTSYDFKKLFPFRLAFWNLDVIFRNNKKIRVMKNAIKTAILYQAKKIRMMTSPITKQAIKEVVGLGSPIDWTFGTGVYPRKVSGQIKYNTGEVVSFTLSKSGYSITPEDNGW